jgi:hypothetical protein
MITVTLFIEYYHIMFRSLSVEQSEFLITDSDSRPLNLEDVFYYSLFDSTDFHVDSRVVTCLRNNEYH